MSAIVATQSVSLDGFSAGANVAPGNPLGDGGPRLHEWIFGLDSWRERHGLEGGERNTEADLIEAAFDRLGAVVMGRRMFDTGEEPWGDDPPFKVPVFVLTHERRDPFMKHGGTSFTFVNEGIERAIELARDAAGERDVSVAGGASAIQQTIAAGLLDELVVDLVPIFLGAGTRLFDGIDAEVDLEPTQVLEGPAATHIRYRVVR